MRQALAGRGAAGADLCQPYFLTLFASALAKSGRIDEALDSLGEAQARIERTGERWWEAETHRLRGKLIRQRSHAGEGEAERCYRTALACARRQHAKSLELRTATDLAGLWAAQGRRAEARDLLAPVYGWFTEGFDTADLKDAKTMLDRLQ
jgi:predicted ATPase